jgi:hypothetical protein
MPRPLPFIIVLDATGAGERCAADRGGALALPSMKEAIQRYEGPRQLVSYVDKNNVKL